MTSRLPNEVEYVIAWQRGVIACDVHRPAGGPSPYCMVNGLGGEVDDNVFTGDPVVTLHSFGGTYEEASDAATVTDDRMNLLILNPGLDVTLKSGVIVNADYVKTLQTPFWLDYGDNTINRFVARYRVGLSSVAVS
jgi:hypothetical protein